MRVNSVRYPKRIVEISLRLYGTIRIKIMLETAGMIAARSMNSLSCVILMWDVVCSNTL